MSNFFFKLYFILSQAAHEVDVLTTKSNFESDVVFGCRACPRFGPSAVPAWDAHFADTYRACRGSTLLPASSTTSSSRGRSSSGGGSGRKKHLVWCDACGTDTATDFNREHLRGVDHLSALARLRRKAEDDPEEEEPSSVLKECPADDCGAKVASEANMALHRKLAGH